MINEESNIKGNLLSTCLFITAISAGVLSVALGLIVLVGWHTGNKALIQILPVFVPMQYSTALGFVLCGAGMILGIFNNRYITFAISLLIIFLGGLTLFGYISGLNLGIDELFMKYYITVKTLHSGKMAPNTAACFSLIGSILAFSIFPRKLIYLSKYKTILASLVFGFSTAVLSGYLIYLDSAYGWGSFTQMAMHTSTGFIVISIGALAFIWRNDIHNEVKYPNWLPIPIAIGALTITVFFWPALQLKYSEIAKESDVSTGLSFVSMAILVVGTLLTFVLSLAVYLSQTAIRRARKLVKPNQALVVEITGRQKAEVQIHKLSHAIEQSSSTVLFTNTEGDIEYANSKFTQLTGYSLKEAIGKNPRILKSGKTPPEVYKELWETITSGNEWQGELCNRKKNGEIYWESASISPVKNEKGVITNFIAIKDDITERKQIDEELKESEYRLNEAQHIAEIGSWEYNLENKQIKWSDEQYRIFGYEPNEIEPTFKKVTNAIHPDDRKAFKEENRRCIDEGDTYSNEYRIIRPDGSERIIHSQAKLIRDDSGNLTRMSGIDQDITERKKIENELKESENELKESENELKESENERKKIENELKESGNELKKIENELKENGNELKKIENGLKESEQRFKELAESIPEVFWIASPDFNRMIYVSPVYETIWGSTCKSLYERPESWMDSIHPDDSDRVTAAIDDHVQGKADFAEEYRIECPDGSTRWITDRAYSIKEESGLTDHIIRVANDITERKKMEEEILRLEELQSQGTITVGVPHELPAVAKADSPKESPETEQEIKSNIVADDEESVEACKQAIGIDPDSATAHYNLGNAYIEVGIYKEAIKAFKQAIKIKPDFAVAHNKLGVAYTYSGMYKKATEACEQAIKINPDTASNHYVLGIAYGGLGMYEEAIEACKQAVRIDPDDAKAHFNLGNVYFTSGMKKEAIEVFKQAIEIEPDYAKVHHNLGLVYSSLNDKDSALEQYKILEDLDHEMANKLFNSINE